MLSKTISTFLLGSVLLVGCGSSAPSDAGAGGMNDAAAAQAEADAALADTPVPPGVDLTVDITDTSASYEAGYGRSAVQGLAMCAWFRYWLAGIEANDEMQTMAAAEAAELFSAWDIYVVADQSFRDLINAVVEKANLGDPAPMAQFVEVNCVTET
jgi:hypothetical protein